MLSSTAQTVASAADNPLTALIVTGGTVLVAWLAGRGASRSQAKKDARDEAPPQPGQDNPWHALAAAWSLISRLRSSLIRVNDYAQRRSTPSDPAPTVDPDLLKE